jgi:ribosomal protein S18 acetylase RimI-like enzyme
MVVTAAADTAQQAQGGLRATDPTRDLRVIADLISEAFAHELDARGRAALRELRWMARLTPLVWWWSQADPGFREAFNGFVWEEPVPGKRGKQIVGNVSLNRAPGSRSRWIICNVVVQDAYQNQGIGRKLTDAATAEARELGARGVLLQVHEDNSPALHLYTSLGFQEAAGETDMQLETVRSVAFFDAPGYRLRAWQPADGAAAYQLAQLVTAEARRWIRPVQAGEYKLDWLTRLGRAIGDLLAGHRVYRLVALREEQLVAMMTVTAALRRDEHRLDLLVHPDHRGQLEVALVSRALHMLAAIPYKPVVTTVETRHTATLKVLHECGFARKRTLLTLYRSLG